MQKQIRVVVSVLAVFALFCMSVDAGAVKAPLKPVEGKETKAPETDKTKEKKRQAEVAYSDTQDLIKVLNKLGDWYHIVHVVDQKDKKHIVMINMGQVYVLPDSEFGPGKSGVGQLLLNKQNERLSGFGFSMNPNYVRGDLLTAAQLRAKLTHMEIERTWIHKVGKEVYYSFHLVRKGERFGFSWTYFLSLDETRRFHDTQGVCSRPQEVAGAIRAAREKPVMILMSFHGQMGLRSGYLLCVGSQRFILWSSDFVWDYGGVKTAYHEKAKDNPHALEGYLVTADYYEGELQKVVSRKVKTIAAGGTLWYVHALKRRSVELKDPVDVNLFLEPKEHAKLRL